MANFNETFKGAKVVEDQIGGYAFKNSLLLRQAFVRKSYSEENGGENNEILEFIGDKVLDLAVIRYLIKRYGSEVCLKNIQGGAWINLNDHIQVEKEFKCDLSEGDLTRLKQKMVQKKALARRIDELEIGRFLIAGEGDKKANISQEDSVKEDLFEAIIGAVALDCNWDIEKIQNVVEVMLDPDSFIEDDEEDDYVSLIYEWTEQKYGYEPHFRYFEGGVSRSWYVRQPNVIYERLEGTYKLNNYKKSCQVMLSTDMPVFEGYGESNNQARKAACRTAYEYLESHSMLLTIKDEIPDPNENDAINQLEILARRGYFTLPKFDYKESHDENGNPVWTVTCKIDGYDCCFTQISASKKQAKKQAAFKTLNYILEHYDSSNKEVLQ